MTNIISGQINQSSAIPLSQHTHVVHCVSKLVTERAEGGGAAALKHVVPLGSEAQVFTHCFGELDRPIGTDILVGDAPRGLCREKDELPLCPELMRQRHDRGEPESGIGGAGLLAGLVGGVVGGVEIGARR